MEFVTKLIFCKNKKIKKSKFKLLLKIIWAFTSLWNHGHKPWFLVDSDFELKIIILRYKHWCDKDVLDKNITGVIDSWFLE